MKKLRQLTFGCSHTQNHYLLQCERWTSVANTMNPEMDFHNFGVNSAGFAFMYHLARELTRAYIPADMVTHVVLQKPFPVRMVWWRDEHPVDVYKTDRMILDKLRKKCEKNYRKACSVELADKIFNYEVEILGWFKELFPNAKFAYYYHWADVSSSDLSFPSLAGHFNRLGDKTEELGMTSLGSIIDPKDVPGVYDDEGDLIWDVKKMYESGWIVFPNDVHPSPKLQAEVAKRIVEWYAN